MAKRIASGDIIYFRYYNVPERKYYGSLIKARVLSVDHFHKQGRVVRPYYVEILSNGFKVWISRKEYKGRVK